MRHSCVSETTGDEGGAWYHSLNTVKHQVPYSDRSLNLEFKVFKVHLMMIDMIWLWYDYIEGYFIYNTHSSPGYVSVCRSTRTYFGSCMSVNNVECRGSAQAAAAPRFIKWTVFLPLQWVQKHFQAEKLHSVALNWVEGYVTNLSSSNCVKLYLQIIFSILPGDCLPDSIILNNISKMPLCICIRDNLNKPNMIWSRWEPHSML